MRTVFRRSELEQTHGSPTVRSRLRTGHWQRPERGVVVTHNGPLSRHELHEVGRCLGPPGTALAGLTALEHDGFTGLRNDQVFIVVPEGARRPRPRTVDVRSHWSTRLDDIDVHPLHEPPRTRTARSVIDAASWAVSDRQARTIVIAAFQQGLVAVRTVREALARRGRCHRRGLVVESMLDAVGGIQSLPERDFDDIRRAAGLPEPSRQVAVKGADGRYYLDVEWTEWGLAVEVHGIPHLEVAQWDDDNFRGNEVVISGRRLVVFSSFAIRHQADRVADQLRRLAQQSAAIAA